MLWDVRYNKVIHRFDRFTRYGTECFTPNGWDVIINSEIWDLRTFKLRQTCPALDRKEIKFTKSGDVMFAYSGAADKSWIQTLLVPSYEVIKQVALDEDVHDLSIQDDGLSFLTAQTGFEGGSEMSMIQFWGVGQFEYDDEYVILPLLTIEAVLIQKAKKTTILI